MFSGLPKTFVFSTLISGSLVLYVIHASLNQVRVSVEGKSKTVITGFASVQRKVVNSFGHPISFSTDRQKQ